MSEISGQRQHRLCQRAKTKVINNMFYFMKTDYICLITPD